ncbi:MAG: hypothetical protein ABL999_13415 [Pyrinomonadaceae bacterium]
MAETGHAKNVANFGTLITFCGGYGADYAPTNALIQIPAMQAKLAAGQAALVDVQEKIVPWKNKVADRENIYKGVRPLSTRMLNAFAACGADANKVDNVRTYNRQVQGARAKALPADDPSTPEIESAGNSVSHQSYVQVAEAFGQNVEILAGEPLYNPNEVALKVVTIQALHTQMTTANTNVVATAVPLSNSRIDRNGVLYAEGTGLTDVAALCKKYVKALYGASSPQYAQVSGLEFRPPRTH